MWSNSYSTTITVNEALWKSQFKLSFSKTAEEDLVEMNINVNNKPCTVKSNYLKESHPPLDLSQLPIVILGTDPPKTELLEIESPVAISIEEPASFTQDPVSQACKNEDTSGSGFQCLLNNMLNSALKEQYARKLDNSAYYDFSYYELLNPPMELPQELDLQGATQLQTLISTAQKRIFGKVQAKHPFKPLWKEFTHQQIALIFSDFFIENAAAALFVKTKVYQKRLGLFTNQLSNWLSNRISEDKTPAGTGPLFGSEYGNHSQRAKK